MLWIFALSWFHRFEELYLYWMVKKISVFMKPFSSSRNLNTTSKLLASACILQSYTMHYNFFIRVKDESSLSENSNYSLNLKNFFNSE